MRSLGFLAVALGCVALLVFKLELRTTITDFLPRDAHSELLEIASALSNSPQTRVVVFTLTGRDPEAAPARSAAFAGALRESGLFEWVRAEVSEQDQRTIYDTLFPARVGLLELPEGEGPVPDAWLDERVRALRERLAGPLGMVERRLAPGDPLGAFSSVLGRQARARGRLRLEGTRLVTEDGRYAVLFASTKASAFDAQAQRKVEAAVARATSAAQRVDATSTVEWSGVNRFAIAGEHSVRGDIERISTLSLLGIFLLYVGVFRSLREPLLVLLPISFGCLLAAAVCQLAFGFVHGLALAFGSSIIGVAEDYSTHYFAHRLAAPASEDNEQLMRRLWPGMWMGGATTIAGIAMLFGSGFPGLQQMAVFGAVGVLGALLCTRYVLPAWSRRAPRTQSGRLSGFGHRLLAALYEQPLRALWFLGPSLLAMAIGLPHVAFEDRVSALRTPSPELEAENLRVQARLGRGAPGRAIVTLGADDEQALQRAEAVRARLEQARARDELTDYRSVVELVPSLASQRARHARLAHDASFVPRLDAVLTQNGFVAEAFQPFAEALKQEQVLSVQALLRSPLAEWVTPFRAQVGERVAYLTPLSVAEGRDVSAWIEGIEGAHYIDQEALFSAAYGRFRDRALAMVALGLVLVLITLLARYRSLRVALLGMVPAVLGAGAALGVEALRGVPITLMHVISMLLVLSMGVDYGIYVLESRHSEEEGVTTLGSVLLAALTTILSFGLLGMSDNPALAAIGSSVGFGMVFTVLASPIVLAFTRKEAA